jgi:FixJ family two-component response regulator
VPDSRPVTAADATRIRTAVAGLLAAQQKLERAVAQALLNGASVRSVADLGLSANTVQKYGRAHGWPTDTNRERFYESSYDREEREGRQQRGPRR